MKDGKQAADFVDNLYKVSRRFRYMETRPQYYGTDTLLYPNEAYTLKAIAERPGISQREISQAMYRTKGATSIAVAKLVQKGLVECRKGSEDHRLDMLYTTEAGMEVYRTHRDYDERYLHMVCRELDVSMEEMARVNDILVRLMELNIRRREQKETF